MRHRIYVAGPYTAPDSVQVWYNICDAARAAAWCFIKGHDVYCPHTHTDGLDEYIRGLELPSQYEDWMRLSFSYIDNWATALLYLKPSPGADRELARARERGLVVYMSVDEIPEADE